MAGDESTIIPNNKYHLFEFLGHLNAGSFENSTHSTCYSIGVAWFCPIN